MDLEQTLTKKLIVYISQVNIFVRCAHTGNLIMNENLYIMTAGRSSCPSNECKYNRLYREELILSLDLNFLFFNRTLPVSCSKRRTTCLSLKM